MAARGKLGRICRALLVAASAIALCAVAAYAQTSNDLADLNARILENPQDIELNLRYAETAEQAGLRRLALAAYERILINDPSNVEARRGYERVRRAIEPSYTVARMELGARWDSNARGATDDSFIAALSDQREAATYYGTLMIANEQEFFGRRWRSLVNVDVEETPEIGELDYTYLGVQTGPIFYAAPHLAVLPAVGGSTAWLGGDRYFSEANLSVMVEGRMSGASYWARVRGGYRDYDRDPSSFFDTRTEQGPYAEIQGGVTKPHLFTERDALTVLPFARWSDVEGSIFSFWLFEELSPGKYVEYGLDVNYNYQINDHIQASVGALVRERDFRESSREDTYVSPQASVTFQNLLPCACDVRLQYRYRDNDTNDYLSDYNAEQVSLSLLTRF